MSAGRFAPSPTGDLHLGNLRTALLSWLFARRTGRLWLVRMEDLDRGRVVPGSDTRQLDDLAALGLVPDAAVVRQSERSHLYSVAVQQLRDAGRVYPCFCTRREIAAAVAAPHAPDGAYPGTCRTLSAAEERRRRDSGRPPALRLRSAVEEFTVRDTLHGNYTGVVDDLVLVRGDGTPAYNLAVVVDDGDQGIDQVVRGDDLLASAPRQAYLASLLDIAVPEYVHVPLALGPTGARLAKRDGAVTLADLAAGGVDTSEVLNRLARSIGVGTPVRSIADVVAAWEPDALPTEPWRPEIGSRG